MMYDFEPFLYLGQIKKGLTQSEVRAIFLNKYESFYKTKSSTVPTDDFLSENFHVYYSDDLIIKGVEVFSPNSVRFKGVNILGVTFTTAFDVLSKIDDAVRMDVYGAYFDALGLSIYSPDHEDSSEAKTEAVYVRF